MSKWVKDKDGYLLKQDDGGEISDIASVLGADGSIVHIQNTGRLIDACAEMKKDAGWSADRSFKRMASIPFLEWIKNPDLANDDDFLMRWLKDHPEYATSHETGGRKTGQVVIK